MTAGSEVSPRPLQGRTAIESSGGQLRARRAFTQPIVARVPTAGRQNGTERIPDRPRGLIELPLAKAQAMAPR